MNKHGGWSDTGWQPVLRGRLLQLAEGDDGGLTNAGVAVVDQCSQSLGDHWIAADSADVKNQPVCADADLAVWFGQQREGCLQCRVDLLRDRPEGFGGGDAQRSRLRQAM